MFIPLLFKFKKCTFLITLLSAASIQETHTTKFMSHYARSRPQDRMEYTHLNSRPAPPIHTNILWNATYSVLVPTSYILRRVTLMVYFWEISVFVLLPNACELFEWGAIAIPLLRYPHFHFHCWTDLLSIPHVFRRLFAYVAMESWQLTISVLRWAAYLLLKILLGDLGFKEAVVRTPEAGLLILAQEAEKPLVLIPHTANAVKSWKIERDNFIMVIMQ